MPKTGGRKKGVPNKATRERQAEIAALGETPLDYMLRVMRDKTAEYDRRDEMAKAAARYVHPALAAVSHSGEMKIVQPETLTDEALAGIAATGSVGAVETPHDTSKLN